MNGGTQFLFEVVAVSPQGSLLTERLRASDATKASEQLQLRGLRVLSCREVKTSSWGQGLRRRRLSCGASPAISPRTSSESAPLG